MSRPANQYPEPRLKVQENGTWWLEWTQDGKAKRQTTHTKDEREARILLNRKSLELLTPVAPSKHMTVEEVCAAYLKSKKRDGKYTDSMRNSLRRVREKIGVAFYDTLTDDVMKMYVSWRKDQDLQGPKHIIDARHAREEKTVSNGTIIREINTLRAALKLCARQNLIKSVPSPYCPVSSSPSKDRYLTTDELGKLLEASKDTPHINLYLQIAYLTGQRRQAILSLKWSAVTDMNLLLCDMVTGYHVDDDKTLKLTRPVTISFGRGVGNKKKAPPIEIGDEVLLQSLYQAYRKRKSEYVIEWHGKPMKSVKTGLRRTCERAGVEPISTHVLRHTAISRLIGAGVNAAVVAKRVGVSPSIIDKHYLHLSPDIQRNCESVLSLKGLAPMRN